MRNRIKIALVFTGLYLAGFVSCVDAPIENTDSLDKEPLWESEKLFLYNSGDLPGSPHNLEILPVYNNVLMTGYLDEDNLARYIGIDILNGEIQWISDEYAQPFHDHRSTIRYQVQDDNIAYFYTNDRLYDENNDVIGLVTPFYAYNISIGNLIFRKVYSEKFGGRVSVLKSMDDIFVSLEHEFINPITNYAEPRFWISHAPEFDHRDTLKTPLINAFAFDWSYIHKIGAHIRDFALGKLSNGDVCLVYIVAEPRYENALDYTPESALHHINCYNITKKEWIYLQKPCKGGGNAIPIADNKVFFGNPGGATKNDLDGLRAYDWETGELLWHLSEFPTDVQVSFSYMSYEPDSQVIVTNEIGHIYGIEGNSGEILWRSKGIGNETSPILFHHGVAYAVSAGGAVYAHDVMTGERLMRAACPSEGREVDGRRLPGFNTNIGMHITEEGKAILFARNYMYAYAFEGVR